MLYLNANCVLFVLWIYTMSYIKSIDADPCSSSPCQNKGACSNMTSSYVCACHGHFGQNCQWSCSTNCWTCSAADQCTECAQGYHVDNDGVCQACPTNCRNCSAADQCTECNQGYHKDNDGVCQENPFNTETTPCISSPCKNGATCGVTLEGDYTCTCKTGFTGENCQFNNSWPIWSPNSIIATDRGTTVKLECQYNWVNDLSVMQFKWKIRIGTLNNHYYEDMWSYSKRQANPSPQYIGKIFVNDTSTLNSMHTLYMKNVTEELHLQCEIKIWDSHLSSSNVVVNVRSGSTGGAEDWPVISATPSIEAEKGSAVDLRCDYEEVKDPKALSVEWWYFPPGSISNGILKFELSTKIWLGGYGKPGVQNNCERCVFVTTGIPLVISHSIRVNNIMLNQAGTFACIVQVEFGTKQGQAMIDIGILVPPSPQLTIISPPSGLYSGDTVSINCTAPSVKPHGNITDMWVDVAGTKHDGQLSITDNGDDTFGVSITIQSMVNKEHDGFSAMCIVGWRNMVYRSDEMLLDVRYPPDNITISSNPAFPIKENSIVVMSCAAEGGNPQPNMTIVRNIMASYDTIGTSPHSMNISKEDDGSQFHCNATGGGIRTDHIVSSSLIASVYYPATSVQIRGDMKSLNELDTLNMTCYAGGGNPDKYTYSWRFVPRHGGEETNVGEQTSVLFLPKITYMHTGKYVCRADNDGGMALTSQVVNISYSPQIIEAEFQQVVHADTDQTVMIDISFWAYPAPTSVTWVTPALGNVTSTSLDQGQDRQLAVLTVTRVNASSFGTYKCVLDNDVGSLVVDVQLKQLSKPNKPSGASADKETAYNLLLLWTAGSDGGSSQTFKVSFKENGEIRPYKNNIPDPGEGNQVSILVDKLTPDTTYSLQVVGVNERGESEPLFYSLKTRVLPPTPTNIHIVQTGDDVEVSWDLPDGDYDTVVLMQCRTDTGACINHTVVEDKTRLLVPADPGTDYTYRLELYQHDVRVAMSENIRQDPAGSNAMLEQSSGFAAIAGGAGGGAALIIIIVVVVVVVVVVKRRKNEPVDKKPINESPSTTVSGHGADFAVYAGVDKPKSTNPKQHVIQEGDPLYDVGPAVPAKDPALQAEIQQTAGQGAAASNGVSSNGVAGDALNHENETTDNEKNKKKEKKGRKEKKEKKPGGYSVVPAPSGEESAYAVAASGSVLPPRAPRHKQDGIYVEVAPSRKAGRGPRPIIGDPNKSDYGIVNFDRKQPIEDPNDSD